MSQSRQLAAIMFTDIVGYTALMGEDEQAAFELLKKNRSVQRPLIEKFNGRWLKEIGDGVLASFSTVSDAVNCAKEIQETCQNEPDLSLRIGIHQGEVVFEGNDVFGDGVNIAARIETITPAGGIYVSESVYRNIGNKRDIEAVLIGEKTLKNIEYPIRVYEIIVSHKGDAKSSVAIDLQIQHNSIAVLPFVNMSADPDQEYFCEGLAEELLNILTKTGKLNVASRTSAFTFKGKYEDISLIGEKLRVRNVLEGSVRKVGSRIRITAQLIDVQSGYHLWSEKFDRQLDDVFAIQDEISQAIADHLNVTFGIINSESVAGHSTRNFQAYDSYLKGRYYLHRYDASVEEAIQHFERAIHLDPNFALAYVGIATTIHSLGDQGIVNPKEVSGKVNTALDQALKLDSTLAEAYVTKGWISAFYDWDVIQAEKHYIRALKLDPNSDAAHGRYSVLLAWMLYRFDDALKEAQKAVEINPINPYNYWCLGVALWFNNRYDEAIHHLQYSVTLDPNSFLNHHELGVVFRLNNQIPEAIKSQQMALEIAGPHPWPYMELGLCYATIKDRDKTKECLNHLHELHQTMKCGVNIAFVYAAIGKTDKAFYHLDQAYYDREPWVPMVHCWPDSEPLRSDLRFVEFVKRVGILTPEMKVV